LIFKKETIGDVLEIIMNGINCKQNKDGYGEKITRIETIAHRKINYQKVGFAKLTEENKKKYKLINNDILFSHINSPIHVGKTALYNGEEDIYHGVNLLKLRVKKHINVSYFNCFLILLFEDGYWAKNAKQSVNQASVNQLDIKKILFTYPVLSEQKRISAKFDILFSEIDRMTLDTEKVKNNIEKILEKSLEKLFNNKIYKERELGSVCKFVGGSQPSKSYFEYESKNSNIRFIQIRDYKSDKHIVYIPKDKTKKFCNKNDVMIGRYGPPLFQILRGLEGAYNVALMKAIPQKEITNDYLFYFLKNKKIQDYIIKKSLRAAGQSGVNKQALEPYKINLPPIIEQNKIVNIIKKIEEQSNILLSLSEKKLESILKLKLSYLKNELQRNKVA